MHLSGEYAGVDVKNYVSIIPLSICLLNTMFLTS